MFFPLQQWAKKLLLFMEVFSLCVQAIHHNYIFMLHSQMIFRYARNLHDDIFYFHSLILILLVEPYCFPSCYVNCVYLRVQKNNP